MENIQFLIKFGERQYMQRLAEGYLYFSYAKKFREIEEKLQQKGQGDYLEGSAKIHGTNMQIYDRDTGEYWGQVAKATTICHFAPANQIPVFCLFTCYKDYCICKGDNEFSINLPENIVCDIRNHFNKADTAAIIVEPRQFIDDINKSFNNLSKAERVHYFNISGIPTKDGQVAQDMEYHKYLTQDTPPEKVKGGIKYSFSADYVYRSLFCKDKFFENENEFRILLPDKEIFEPKEFYVRTTSPIKLFDIDSILNGDTFSIK